jgi:hypothetical protein
MHNMKTYVIFGLLFMIVGVLAYRYWRSSTVSFECENETLREASSPDGKYVASVFERNCGATTPYYRIVAIRPAGTRLDADKHEDWVFVTKERSEVQLAWRDIHRLEVVANGPNENGNDRKLWRDVEITTKPSSP